MPTKKRHLVGFSARKVNKKETKAETTTNIIIKELNASHDQVSEKSAHYIEKQISTSMPDYLASWMPQEPELIPFYEGINNVLEKLLRLPSSKQGIDEICERKIIADPIVGYIHLNPWEVALIDTKLFQRLRRIRQLGLAYQVFPTLGYSRFEHTLGVIGRLDQVLTTLRTTHRRIDKDEESSIEKLINSHEIALRLAALFHDLGHCIFSHVSERVISNLPGQAGKYPSAERISQCYISHFKKDYSNVSKIQFAELISVTILGNKQIQVFLNKQNIPRTRQDDIESWIKSAARFIIGVPLENQPVTFFLAQLMSGGLDVDKIDYMSREAYFSGVKLEIDFDRIFDKLRVFTLKANELPVGLRSHANSYKHNDGFKVLGFAKGGQFAFEEFCISRVALYDKIYLHQKIRAAEAHLQATLHSLSKTPLYQCAHKWIELEESDVIEATSNEEMLELWNSCPSTKVQRGWATIGSRDLLHRAFAFGPANSISDPVDSESKAVIGDGIKLASQKFLEDVSLNIEKFKNDIWNEAVQIARLLKIDLKILSEDDLIIDPPRYRSVQQGHDSLYFEKPSRLPLRWIIPIDQIVEYYRKNRALAYVFAPLHYCPLIQLAAERVSYDWSQSVFIQDDAVSKLVANRSQQYKQKLAKTNYYTSYPAIRAVSDYLLEVGAQEIIQEVATNLRSFESYAHDRVTVANIMAYICQFPIDLQKSALELLRHIEVIDDTVLANAIVDYYKLLDQNKRKNTALVPLGAIWDSASHLTYRLRLLRHEKQNINLFIPEFTTLNDAVVKRSERLLFFDDNVNSGSQALNILAEWLGVKLPEKLDLKERHVQKLGREAIRKLRKMPINFVFAIGPYNASDRIKSCLNKYLKIPESNITVHVQRELLDSQKIFSGPDSPFKSSQCMKLKAFYRSVGEGLMLNEPQKTKAIAESRALGDENAEGRYIFPYNVPTMTLTALWCAGEYYDSASSKKIKWVPLTERRRRRNPDGAPAGRDA